MFAILAHIRPLDLRTNTRVDVRVASTSGSAFQGLGGFAWESAITRRPKASIELFSIDLTPGTKTAQADFEISLAHIFDVDTTSLHWAGAPVTIYRADDLRWPAVIEFDGVVTEDKPDLEEDKFTLNCQALLQYDKPLLTKEFGDTDLEFDADKRTELLPAGFGVCLNVEPKLFDSIRYIYMLDGYGNLQSVEWTGEGLSSLGPVYSDYPTYDDLKAALDGAQVPPGRWATCIAEGLIALGAPPQGVITCHATFGFGMTGAMIRRIVAAHALVAPEKTEDASFTALDTAVPYPIHYWTADQVEVKTLVEALAAGCNASPIVTMQGKLAVLRPFGGAQIGEFIRNGYSEPAVTKWASNGTITPSWRIAARVARPIRVMTTDEINYVDDLIDRGLYDPDQTYRQGNIVWLRDKSQWLYINETADKGHAPPEGTLGDAYWTQMAPAQDAQDLKYADGQYIEDLQPAEAGAQISRNINVAETSLKFTFGPSNILVPGQLPKTVRATLTEANYDVTIISSWSISTTGGVTATIDNTPSSPTRGQITITGVTADGTIVVTAMRGESTPSATISITTQGSLADESVVTTPFVADDAITDVKQGANGSTITGTGAYVDVVSLSLPLAYDGSAILTAVVAQTFNSGAQPWGVRLLIDGVVVNTITGNSVQVAVPISTAGVVAAGSHTMTLQWMGDSTMQLNAGGSSLVVLRRYK